MLDPRRKTELERCLQKLGLGNVPNVDWDLFDQALTHMSVSLDRNYERLEFMGDAVIRLVATEVLTDLYPEASVGELAAVRSIVVSDRTLAEIGDHYGLERYLLVSPMVASDQSGARSRLADATEAVTAILYLCTGTTQWVHTWLDQSFTAYAQTIWRDPARQNYKAALQEWTQAKYKQLPSYHTEEISHMHGDAERFFAEVWFQDRCLGKGKGRSIKAAEQAAAQVAYFSVVHQAE